MATQTAPAATAATAGAATTAAPSAAAPVKTSLSDFAEAARKSIAEEHPNSQRAAEAAALAATTETAGEESPTAETEVATEEAVQSAEETTDEAEPTAEEQANWTEGEKRIHGALVKERAERKAAKAETKELREKFAALEARLNTAPSPTQAQPAKGQPGTDTTAPVTAAAPSVETTALGDCQTFEAVDARVMQASTTETQVLSVQKTLARKGVEAAAQELKTLGVNQINGVPVVELDGETITDFLDTVSAGVQATRDQAAPRKSFISQQAAAWQQAAKIMPELEDVNSDFHKQVAHLVTNTPQLKGRPDWPVVAVKLVMGHQAFTAKAKPAAATPARPAATAPVKPAPGAPRRAAGAVQPTNGLDAIRVKIANGTATIAEVQAMARESIGVAG